ncbi:MAG: UDP-N-acetylmuramoyl-tripeptide--D-alanyl-D-alanine ligase [Corynebacteriales bacterium]|nr:UDP-N-acetylmuramoyl-tripeptide--D-alanyl-D-alanine ligase [Mycobacteriales bacterium]
MIPLTVREIADAVGGHMSAVAPEAIVRAPAEFDSRAITAGGMFIALAGERVDGHDFAEAATRAGAVVTLASRDVRAPAIIVDDVLQALGKLARYLVDRLPDLTIVGITGSSGKTSAKDLIAQLLAPLGQTIAPPGSFNNELGHPTTVLRAQKDTKFLVLEKGARGPGHISWLTEIAPPRIGVVLNVGAAHLGEFGDIETTAQAKGELVAALPPEGVAVLNADDPRVAVMSTKARTVFFGLSAQADVRAENVVLHNGRAHFDLVTSAGRQAVRLKLFGEHHVSNALAAAAVALEAGAELPQVAKSLNDATALSGGRMAVTERPDGVTIINDAYNANPDSMRAALNALTAIAGEKRSWAVLGNMAELGPHAQEAHQTIGAYAAELGVDRLVVIGENATSIHAGAIQSPGFRGESHQVSTAQEALAYLTTELRANDVVLVKASLSAGLQRVALDLIAGETA